MMSTYLISELQRTFQGQEYITRNELYEFFKRLEPDLKESTFGWRIYDLRSKGIIASPRRSIYVLTRKKIYRPFISEKLQKVANKLIRDFPHIKYSIFDFEWFNEFTVHQFWRPIFLIEVQKDIVSTVYHKFKDMSKYDVFTTPDSNVIMNYVQESDNPIIIKPLITRSPTTKVEGYNLPSLEKVLVDIYCDSNIFYMYGESEKKNIYRFALEHYMINLTTLTNYAKRRNRFDEIKNFIRDHNDNQFKSILL